MNTKQLNHFAYLDEKISKKFLGTFAIDLVPKVIKSGFLIVNTLKSNEVGEGHWVALYISGNKLPNEYFDSYAFPVFDKRLINLLKSKYKRLKVRLQAINSDVCGQYCLFFIYHKARGVSYSELVKIFKENNSKFNDNIVRKFFREKATFRLK
jgi:hypothetical protein